MAVARTPLLLLLLFSVLGAEAAGKLGKLNMGDEVEMSQQQKEAFAQADANNDGQIAFDEYIAMLEQTLKAAGREGIAPEQMAELQGAFQQVDTDGSGGMSVAEWQAMAAAGMEKAKEAEKAQEEAANLKLKAVYDDSDANKDGKLSQEEMLGGFAQYGYTAEQIALFFGAGDVDTDGLLTFSEFLHARTEMQRKKEVEELMGAVQSEAQQEQAFKEADANNDGAITLLEYEQVFAEFMKTVGGKPEDVDPKLVLDNFQQYDTDRNGGVSMGEWKAALHASAQEAAAGKSEL